MQRNGNSTWKFILKKMTVQRWEWSSNFRQTSRLVFRLTGNFFCKPKALSFHFGTAGPLIKHRLEIGWQQTVNSVNCVPGDIHFNSSAQFFCAIIWPKGQMPPSLRAFWGTQNILNTSSLGGTLNPMLLVNNSHQNMVWPFLRYCNFTNGGLRPESLLKYLTSIADQVFQHNANKTIGLKKYFGINIDTKVHPCRPRLPSMRNISSTMWLKSIGSAVSFVVLMSFTVAAFFENLIQRQWSLTSAIAKNWFFFEFSICKLIKPFRLRSGPWMSCDVYRWKGSSSFNFYRPHWNWTIVRSVNRFPTSKYPSGCYTNCTNKSRTAQKRVNPKNKVFLSSLHPVNKASRLTISWSRAAMVRRFFFLMFGLN